MPHPFPNAPSLKQFVDIATRQDCVEGVIERTGLRYLQNESNVVAFLPDIADDELIAPGKLAELVRHLGVTGYEDFLVQYGYGPDGANKPSH